MLDLACGGRSEATMREGTLWKKLRSRQIRASPGAQPLGTPLRRATSLPHHPVPGQVPESDLPAFNKFLTQLHYPYFRECDNPAYKRFLAGS
eukprot:scaffold1693_cov109-Isochrysis_galbana.AAC.3